MYFIITFIAGLLMGFIGELFGIPVVHLLIGYSVGVVVVVLLNHHEMKGSN